MPRLHIGHHFFGSGNIGDDFMLAGFLEIAREFLGSPALTCCTPFDRDAQRLRLPDVTWFPYETGHRERAIEAADAWIGVGDSPFQSEVGSWMLDHLSQELEICRRHGKQMFYFCVGVNDYAAVQHPITQTIVNAAAGIWTRDRQSTELLRRLVPDTVFDAADLANVFFARRPPATLDRGTVGLLLNFEDRSAFSADALLSVLDSRGTSRAAWLVQEVRTLSGSEWELLGTIPPGYRSRLDVRAPDYATAGLNDLAECWGFPETVVTSRYHGALLAAWSGARVVVIERNAKLTGLVEQLGLVSVKDLRTAGPLLKALDDARAVDRERLEALGAAVTTAARRLAAALS